jgi:hypothetical protein
MITKDEANRGVLEEWDRWWTANRKSPDQTATGTNGSIFFGWLQQNRYDLLSFRGSGDKWQTVHG